MYSDKEMEQLIEDAFIMVDEETEENTSIISVKGNCIASLGNFSAIIGQPKSKKTFFISYLISQWLKNNSEHLKINVDEKRKSIIYFDTEQAKQHTKRTVKRALTLSLQDELYINTYNLRKHTPKLRRDIIRNILDEYSYNTTIVIIDGLRDLVNSINDEKECSLLIMDLLKWSQEYNIHIIVVLHQNPFESKARGHLGTEVVNKAETVIQVAKDKINENISHVSCEYSRDKEFEDFSFEINEAGLPVIINNFEPLRKKKTEVQPITQDQLKIIIIQTMKENPSLNYKELQTNLQSNFIKNNLNYGEKKIKSIITNYTTNQTLQAKKQKNQTIYTLK